MKEKSIELAGKTYKLQSMGNLELIAVASGSAGDMSKTFSKLIINTVKDPVLSVDDIETMEKTDFAKLFAEVIAINEYGTFIETMNTMSKMFAPAQKQPYIG